MKRLAASACIVVATLLLATCGGKPQVRIPEEPGRVDAPYELQSDEDLTDTRLLYEAMAVNDKRRATMRRSLAAEYARRIDDQLGDKHPVLAYQRFEELMTLWSPSELAAAQTEMAVLVPQAQAILKRYSRAGGTSEATAALTALGIMQPNKRLAYQREIEEILAYSEELAISRDGPSARRAYPIRILEHTAEFLPTQAVIERLLALYLERQSVINSSVRRGNANIDMALLRLHGEGLLTTTRNIVRLLTQSERFTDIVPAIAKITGIGDDMELRKRVQAALTSTDAGPWLTLSAMFRSRPRDQRAALALCREAIRRHPKSTEAYLTAAEVAQDMGNAALAIRYYEQGLALDGDYAEASGSLAALYEQRVNELAHTDRPNAALRQLKKFEAFHARAQEVLGNPVEPDLASAYAVMAKGLVSLGDLGQAREYLARSLKLRTNLSSLEYLGLIALRQGQYAAAREHFASALALEGQGFGAEFDEHRLRRFAAEALLAEARPGHWIEVERELKHTKLAWLKLLATYEVPDEPKAEALIELGKVEFLLGNKDQAVEHFFQATNAAPHHSSNQADLVAFLVNQGADEDARDLFLDALGNDQVSQYYKIYMSMWILAEAAHKKIEPDPHALQFLLRQDSSQWSASLARYIVGKGDRASVEKMASTRGRRAELLYYSAVLGPESRKPKEAKLLLEEVLRGEMVLFFEYEMAKRRLQDL